MVGYSRLMEADERGTIARQKAHRAELIDPMIAKHHGRIVKLMGDGMLVEFASVVDAVECGVALQRAMAEREAEVPDDRRIQYRVGVNLGDIVIEDEDIFGDGRSGLCALLPLRILQTYLRCSGGAVHNVRERPGPLRRGRKEDLRIIAWRRTSVLR